MTVMSDKGVTGFPPVRWKAVRNDPASQPPQHLLHVTGKGSRYFSGKARLPNGIRRGPGLAFVHMAGLLAMEHPPNAQSQLPIAAVLGKGCCSPGDRLQGNRLDSPRRPSVHSDRFEALILCMDDLLHHLKNSGTVSPLQIPTNLMVATTASKWCEMNFVQPLYGFNAEKHSFLLSLNEDSAGMHVAGLM